MPYFRTFYCDSSGKYIYFGKIWKIYYSIKQTFKEGVWYNFTEMMKEFVYLFMNAYQKTSLKDIILGGAC